MAKYGSQITPLHPRNLRYKNRKPLVLGETYFRTFCVSVSANVSCIQSVFFETSEIYLLLCIGVIRFSPGSQHVYGEEPTCNGTSKIVQELQQTDTSQRIKIHPFAMFRETSCQQS
nr:PREDICTED: uncharacterized protein LOC105662672 [Megachile rotundata]